MKKRKIVVTESELINSIDKIVKEQAAMLGFGNMGGLSLGVSKPSDKYQEMYEDDAHDTYNVNYMDQEAANKNMEDWEMGEDYSIERGSHGHPHEMEEGKKAKPDYLDFDKDGNKKESMKKALKDKKGKMTEKSGCGSKRSYGVDEAGCGGSRRYNEEDLDEEITGGRGGDCDCPPNHIGSVHNPVMGCQGTGCTPIGMGGGKVSDYETEDHKDRSKFEDSLINYIYYI